MTSIVARLLSLGALAAVLATSPLQAAVCDHGLLELEVSPDAPLDVERTVDGILEGDTLWVRNEHGARIGAILVQPDGGSVHGLIAAMGRKCFRLSVRGYMHARGDGYAPDFVALEIFVDGKSVPFLTEDIERMKKSAVMAIRERFSAFPDITIPSEFETSIEAGYKITAVIRVRRGFFGERYLEHFQYDPSTGGLEVLEASPLTKP